jgi:hypothetical protein
MNSVFWDMLAGTAKAGELERIPLALQRKLQILSAELDLFLGSSDSATRNEILANLCAEILRHLPSLGATADQAIPNGTQKTTTETVVEQTTPASAIEHEILEWASQQFNEEETVAGMHEIRETGGLELSDFLKELEREAMGRE